MRQVRACPCRNFCSTWSIYSAEGMECLGTCRRQAVYLMRPSCTELNYIGANMFDGPRLTAVMFMMRRDPWASCLAMILPASQIRELSE